jgi:ribonucrease Y
MIIYLLVGVTAGAALVALLFFLVRRQTIRDAEEEAKEILTEARDLHANEELERKERVQEIELEAWSHVEETHLLIEQKCEDLEASIQQKKIAHEEKIKNSRALLLQKENSLRDHSIKLTTRQAEIQKIADHRKSIEDSYKSELTQKTQLVESEIVAQIKE